VSVSFLTEPISRVRAIIEGSYPATPVTGRSVPASTIQKATYEGDPADLQWTGIGFHRRYQLPVLSTRNVDADKPNSRAGSQRKLVVFEVQIGYLVSPDSPIGTTSVCASVDEATALGHSDHELIAQAFQWSAFWSGTSPEIAGLVPAGDVSTAIIIPRKRIIVSARWSMLLHYAPGTAWT